MVYRNCIIVAGIADNQNPEFKITDTNLYDPVVTWSIQENIKLLKQVESAFKRKINSNKYLAKTKNQGQTRYLDFLIDLIFQGVNIFFVLPFKDDDDRESHKLYYLPTAEIKDDNVMIDGRNFFDQPIKHDLKTYDNIRKIATDQGDDCTAGYLSDYPYFKKYYKIIAKDLSKQQKLDADPKTIQKINFIRNLDRVISTTMFLLLKRKRSSAVLDFSKKTVKLL